MSNQSQQTCLSLKRVELAMNRTMKLSQVDVDRLQQHKKNILQSEKDGDRATVRAELERAHNSIKQLRTNLTQMEKFRLQLTEEDRPKFDKKFGECASLVNDAIQHFRDLDRDHIEYMGDEFAQLLQNVSQKDESPYIEPKAQKQKSLDVTDAKAAADIAKEEAETLEGIEGAIHDVKDMMSTLSSMTQEQAAKVDTIEDNIESSRFNILEGGKKLTKALGYKAAGFTLMGATIGALVGGPIGLMAGTKIGMLAAGAGGTAGIIAGRKLKQRTENQAEVELEQMTTASEEVDKAKPSQEMKIMKKSSPADKTEQSDYLTQEAQELQKNNLETHGDL